MKTIYKLSLSCLILLTPTFMSAQWHWESMVKVNSIFKYLGATSEPPTVWNDTVFDDSAWLDDKGSIGYADNDDTTVIAEVNSLYLRKEILISDTSIIGDLILNIDYDDAFVAYINGKEVARSSNVTEENPTYNSTLTIDREATGSFERYDINGDILFNGNNLLAIHIINMSLTSSDLSSLVYLQARVNSPDTLYFETPSWFVGPGDFSYQSKLPIIVIDNYGREIPDDPRDIANMKVYNSGTINYTDSTTYEYNGQISIETRGSSSQYFFPKNSFGLETQTDSGTNNNVSLLGMPPENDWVLYAPYSDKTMMRNALAYFLANKTERWSPRTRYCEVFVNEEYLGIYILTEKIKRDKNRVDIAKLRSDENAGDSLTGGYILKVDRGEDFWMSSNNGEGDIKINYHYPEGDDITPQQKTYIQNTVGTFENKLISETFNDLENGYRNLINTESFIDYYLLNEFSRNVDAYILSTFFYKDKNSNDPKIIMGPFWDYNLAYGNANYRSGYNPRGWVEPANEPAPFWFNRLLEDEYYQSDLKERWLEIRDDWLNQETIYDFMDSVQTMLGDAVDNNFEKWPILGGYIWPNDYIGDTYEDEITFMKDWIRDRLSWMDGEIRNFEIIPKPWGVEDSTSATFATSIALTRAYPNPFSNELFMAINSNKDCNSTIQFYSITGQLIHEQSATVGTGKNFININTSNMNNYVGVMIYKVYDGKNIIAIGKLLKE